MSGRYVIGWTNSEKIAGRLQVEATKETDYVNGKTLTFGHIRMMELAALHGLYCHDLIIHHTGPGPGGHNIFIPKRARRTHSYLVVFRKAHGRSTHSGRIHGGAAMTNVMYLQDCDGAR